MTSSIRGPGVCDAIVMIDGRQVGLIRLPKIRSDDFVDHFNRTYRELGLQLRPVAGESESPAASPTTKENPRQHEC